MNDADAKTMPLGAQRHAKAVRFADSDVTDSIVEI